MRICFISRFYKPYIKGGAEIYVGKIAEKLAERGYDVFVITPSQSKEEITEDINNVRVYRISPFNVSCAYEASEKPIYQKIIYHILDLFNVDSYRKIRKILEEERPNIVHIHNYKGLSAAPFKAVKDLKIPLIFTAHDFSLLCVRSTLLNSKEMICENPPFICELYKRLQRFLVNGKVEVFTSPSKFVLEKLSSNGFFNEVPKLVLRNSIEQETYCKIKKNYDTIDILFVGSLSRHKGPNILIKSFRDIDADNLRLHIVGRGPIEEELKKMAKDDWRIIFHGFLSGKALAAIYRRANVTVLPSICYDNSPLVIYESFMNSTPVIASRIGGIPELVTDGYNGVLFEAGNVSELTSLINKIAEDPSILEGLERGAYESCKQYQIEVTLERLISIYKDLLQKDDL
ncbi:glycosyltransferase family 4 protein [Methanothermobacter sp. K4]|uniref:glycosyltransferase family 4 protein n=1 Tax=Methanothermobacter sp. K4 TaxID=2913262 RepID=UPI001EDC0319|nr:glycosyltransferase family 4 protein [Methanothermobacter sp. K4]MCG2829233.1 glycosyltransferase family 4 protein [Methanothermobacter sp. K4]